MEAEINMVKTALNRSGRAQSAPETTLISDNLADYKRVI